MWRLLLACLAAVGVGLHNGSKQITSIWLVEPLTGHSVKYLSLIGWCKRTIFLATVTCDFFLVLVYRWKPKELPHTVTCPSRVQKNISSRTFKTLVVMNVWNTEQKQLQQIPACNQEFVKVLSDASCKHPQEINVLYLLLCFSYIFQMSPLTNSSVLFQTAEQYYRETGIQPMETRRVKFTSLDGLLNVGVFLSPSK